MLTQRRNLSIDAVIKLCYIVSYALVTFHIYLCMVVYWDRQIGRRLSESFFNSQSLAARAI
jgi:hypothetical protein